MAKEFYEQQRRMIARLKELKLREMSAILYDVLQYNDEIPISGSLKGVQGESGTREGPEELKCESI